MNDDDLVELHWMVLINHEGQHSLWPALNDIPAGWQPVGPVGSKDVCMSYVDVHWTDMRPLSLRTNA